MRKPITTPETPEIDQVRLDAPQIRQGYKQTEVGVIPEEWGASTIGENSEWMSGGTPRRNNAEFWSGNIPWISGSTLKDSEISTSDQFLTAEAVAAGSKMAPVDSTLLLVRGSALHNEIRAGLVALPVAFNQDVKALVPNPTVLPKYLTYYILGCKEELLKLVSSAGNSAGVLDTELVQSFKFLKPPPPLPEQCAIATALSDVDALLAAQNKLIAKKRDIKQATMQQLLTGKTRLPGFSGEWEVKRLGDRVEIRKGQLITEKEAVIGSVPVIAGGKKPAYYHNKANRTGKTVTISASGASAGYVAFFDRPIFASDCSTISENQTYSIEFIFFQLQLKQDVIYKAQTGGAQPHIHAVDLIPIEIGYPTLSEQKAIAAALSDMDAELTTLEQQRDKTIALKQGMMQELLTGRIRLV